MIDCIVVGKSWVARAVAENLSTTVVGLENIMHHNLDAHPVIIHADACPNLDSPMAAWGWVMQVLALRVMCALCHWIQCTSPYVLAGAGYQRPYSASAERRPITFEGEVATALEWGLLSLGTQMTIVRPGLLYDDAPGGLLQWAIGIVETGLGQVPPLIVSPTPVDLFAGVVGTLARTRGVGIYHAACRGQASYWDIVRVVSEHLRLPMPQLDWGARSLTNLSLTSTARLGRWDQVLHERLADLTKGS